MVQLRTLLNIADNTGVLIVSFIQVLGKGKRPVGYIGDVIIAAVKKATPESQIKERSVVKAVIVRTKKEKRRKDGSYIRFSDNAVVLIDNEENKELKGTRIFGPVARELKAAGFDKIVSLATEVY